MPKAPKPVEASPEAKAKLGKVVGGAGAATLLLGLVAAVEGKSNDPYFDIVKIETVCFGETNVEMRHYSDQECADMLASSLGSYAEGVKKRNPDLPPYQLAAATSLAYNIGLGNYRKSTVAKRFSAHDYRGGCDAFLSWSYAGGKRVKGLYNRRVQEREICLRGAN